MLAQVFNFKLLPGLVLCCIVMLPGPVAAQVWQQLWQNLWQTPQQQHHALEQQGDYQALIDSDSHQWQGAGHYRNGDFASAAQSFADAYAQSEDIRSQYNQGTALTQAGDYDAAIDKFETLLEADPTHAKAAHNLDIARRLKELQQQQEQQDQQQQDQENENENQQNQSEQQNEQNNQQDSDQQQSGQQQDESDQNPSADPQESDSVDSAQNKQEEQQSQQEKQQQQQQQEQNESAQQQASSAAESEEPLSEDQQAMEQWLRKIPDDPSGLLRRKLLRSHRTDYPHIRDSQSPW